MSEFRQGHRFALEHFAPDGRSLGQALVEPDFQPARECAYFAAVRRGALPLVTAPAEGEVAPVWSEELGPPHCSGVRVGGCDFSSAYFLDLAQQQAAVYVASGALARGDSYHYRVLAYPAVDAAAASASAAELEFGAEALADPIPLSEGGLGELLARSEAIDGSDPNDAPVFVAAGVVSECRQLAARAGDVEAGGVLVGRLHRDRLRPEVFVEVTAQIPARHAEARGASFAFTPETWAAADAAIALRGAEELTIGWWHSHPQFCRDCPPERWSACAFARPFFSAEDVHLHRTCFPRAWSIALLVSDLPDGGPTPALFGWRMGKVVRRGFGRLRPTPEEEEES
jgi:hypothetical protein